MPAQFRVMSVSRPVTFVIILTICMVHLNQDLPRMALVTLATGFYIASSAVIVGWLPAPRRWVVGAWWAEVAMAVVLNLVIGSQLAGGSVSILFYPIAVTACLVLERRQWLAGIGALWGGWIVTSLPLWRSVNAADALAMVGIYGVLLLFTTNAGVLIRNLMEQKERADQLVREVEESRAATERAHRRLSATLAQQQEMAVLEERQRLAREIHDSVAHSLTALVVQIQAGRRLMDHDTARAAEVVGRCEEMAREALQETRRAVRALHPAGLEQQTDVEALRRLARDYGVATGMEVVIQADPSVADLRPDPNRLEQLYRIMQESLTNAHRHGQAQHVTASLRVAEAVLRLSISNDGLPPETLDPGVGFQSMRERAHLIGGTLTIHPGVRGLTVEVTVPLGQEDPA